MKHLFTRRLFAAVAPALMAVVPLSALAADEYSWDGNDYSVNGGSYNFANITVCDGESDSNGAYTNYQVNGQGGTYRLNDPNGSGGGCGYASGYIAIYSHRVCEDIAFYPDSCGPTKYPVY